MYLSGRPVWVFCWSERILVTPLDPPSTPNLPRPANQPPPTALMEGGGLTDDEVFELEEEAARMEALEEAQRNSGGEGEPTPGSAEGDDAPDEHAEPEPELDKGKPHEDPRITVTQAEDHTEYIRQVAYLKRHPGCPKVPSRSRVRTGSPKQHIRYVAAAQPACPTSSTRAGRLAQSSKNGPSA